MVFQSGLPRVLFITTRMIADIRLRILVGLFMRFSMAISKEVLFAVATLVGPFPSVCSDVSLQIAYFFELPEALAVGADDNFFAFLVNRTPL